MGQILLLLATLAWGTSFAILKETIAEVPKFFVLGVRFSISALVLFAVFYKKIVRCDRKLAIKGLLLGVILALAYLTQTTGLEYTTPSMNAFITCTYCMICPFLLWILYKEKPKLYNIIAGILCITGVGLILFSGKSESASNMWLGNILTAISAFFFAFQLIGIDRFQRKQKCDPICLLFFELMAVAIIYNILSVIFEIPVHKGEIFNLTSDQILKIGYLTFVCTLFAQFAQLFAQRFVPPNQSTIILNLEAVFGAVFSVLLGHEVLSAMAIAGFIVVFLAQMTNETKFDPIAFYKKRSGK